MKFIQSLILGCFLLITSQSTAQLVERVEIKGLVKANTNDVLGVTVYNLTSKKGVITSEKGEFKIGVAVNDVLDISSLVFQDFKVTISEEDLKNKFITVFLVEMVNNLDEVLILRGDLTGLLDYDVSQVSVFDTTIDINLGSLDMSQYEFSDDYKTAASNIITRQGDYYNMANGAEIVKLISGLFKNKNKKKKNSIYPNISDVKTLTLQDKYKPDFYINNFNIPTDSVQAFIVYVEKNGLNSSLLSDENEINLIEFIKVKSDLFLKK